MQFEMIWSQLPINQNNNNNNTFLFLEKRIKAMILEIFTLHKNL